MKTASISESSMPMERSIVVAVRQETPKSMSIFVFPVVINVQLAFEPEERDHTWGDDIEVMIYLCKTEVLCRLGTRDAREVVPYNCCRNVS